MKKAKEEPAAETPPAMITAIKHKGLRARAGSMEIIDRAEGEAADAPRRFRFSISSDSMLRQRTDSGLEYWEVLSHEPGDVDLAKLNAGASIRDTHYGPAIGRVRGGELNGNKLYTTGAFSRGLRGRELEADVIADVAPGVSIGYDVLKYVPQGRHTDGLPILRAKRWQPYHVAVVPDAEDVSVGFGRSQKDDREFTAEIEGELPDMEVGMLREKAGNDGPAGAGGGAAAASAVIEITAEERGEIRQAERDTHIRAMCEARGVGADAAELIASEMTTREAAAEILKRSATRGKSTGAGAGAVAEVDFKDAKRYSLTRALRAQLAGKPLDGFEGEMHRHIEGLLPSTQARHENGILVPTRLFLNSAEGQMRARGERALGSQTAGGGAEIVFEQPGQLIEILRPRAMVIQSGATWIPGLSAPVPYPVQTGDVDVQAMAENPGSPVSDSSIAFDTILLSPKTIQSTVPIPRQLIVQSSLDVEQLVRNSIQAKHDRKIDFWALHGSGADGQALGIYNTADVNEFDFLGTDPDWAGITQMPAKIAAADADIAAQRWLLTPEMAAVLQATPKAANQAIFIYEGGLRAGQMAGFDAATTNQFLKTLGTGADHGMIFGAWSECVIGQFGAMEVVVDGLTLATKGQIRVTSFQMVDVLIRHPQAFTRALRFAIPS